MQIEKQKVKLKFKKESSISLQSHIEHIIIYNWFQKQEKTYSSQINSEEDYKMT